METHLKLINLNVNVIELSYYCVDQLIVGGGGGGGGGFGGRGIWWMGEGRV